jgi:hypothetical protein
MSLPDVIRPLRGGFTRSGLSRMMALAEIFPDEQIVATLSQQLSWCHFCRADSDRRRAETRVLHGDVPGEPVERRGPALQCKDTGCTRIRSLARTFSTLNSSRRGPDWRVTRPARKNSRGRVLILRFRWHVPRPQHAPIYFGASRSRAAPAAESETVEERRQAGNISASERANWE